MLYKWTDKPWSLVVFNVKNGFSFCFFFSPRALQIFYLGCPVYQSKGLSLPWLVSPIPYLHLIILVEKCFVNLIWVAERIATDSVCL